MKVPENKSKNIISSIYNNKYFYNIVYGNPEKIRNIGLFLQKQFDENLKSEIFKFQQMALNSLSRRTEVRKAIEWYGKYNTSILIPDLNFSYYNPTIAINSFEKLFIGIEKHRKEGKKSLVSKVILLSKDSDMQTVFPTNNDYQKRFEQIVSENFKLFELR